MVMEFSEQEETDINKTRQLRYEDLTRGDIYVLLQEDVRDSLLYRLKLEEGPDVWLDGMESHITIKDSQEEVVRIDMHIKITPVSRIEVRDE